MKKIIKKIFNLVGLEVVNHKAQQQNSKKQQINDIERMDLLSALTRLEYVISKSQFDLSKMPDEFALLKFSCGKLTKSKSQLFQDLFVLHHLNNKRNGFFIEFGATDGISLSNSYLLETEFDWKGILCEPGKVWQKSLSENRKAKIDFRCVWSKTGEEFLFNETEMPELSSLEMFNDADYFAEERKKGQKYAVQTVSLTDLLNEHNAPQQIDYLSIDTEGSEYDILDAFDFSKFSINIITVEHNFSTKRNDIYKLLTGKGYKRVFDKISLFDDWYVLEEKIED